MKTNTLILLGLIQATILLLSSANAGVSDFGVAKVKFTELTGVGEEKGVMRRDPSDVIKVGDLLSIACWSRRTCLSAVPGWLAAL